MKYIDYLCTYCESSKYIVDDKYQPGLREGSKKGQEPQDNHLDVCLKKLYPNHTFERGKYVRLDGKCVQNLWYSRICVDYICEELKIIVEFDGESWQGGGHFTDPNVCLKDEYNTRVLTDMGYKVIRIPYYVQLDQYTIKYYFGINYNEELYRTCGDHGFLYPDCKTPAYFCEHGLNRFYKDLLTLPHEISLNIIMSLMMRFSYNIQTFSNSIISDRYILRTNLTHYISSICNEKTINICKFILIDSGYNYWVMPKDYNDFTTPMDADMFGYLMCISSEYDINNYAEYIEKYEDDPSIEDPEDREVYCHWEWKSQEKREEFLNKYIKTS